MCKQWASQSGHRNSSSQYQIFCFRFNSISPLGSQGLALLPSHITFPLLFTLCVILSGALAGAAPNRVEGKNFRRGFKRGLRVPEMEGELVVVVVQLTSFLWLFVVAAASASRSPPSRPPPPPWPPSPPLPMSIPSLPPWCNLLAVFSQCFSSEQSDKVLCTFSKWESKREKCCL